MAGDDNGNGRVTLAVLGEKMDTAIGMLKEMERKQDADHDRITVLEGELQRTNDKVSRWQGIQAAIAAILSALAAFIGTQR